MVAVHPSDWALQCCALGDPLKDDPETITVYVHMFGTYGISSIAYWWGGLAATVGRLMYYVLGPDAWFWILLYADDFFFLAFDGKFAPNIVMALWVLAIFGFPLSWRKFKGGFSVGWIGLELA